TTDPIPPTSRPDAPSQASVNSPPGDNHLPEAPQPRRITSTRARTHARTDADVSARVRLAMREDLHRKLQAKQRLTSYTFRFRPEELDHLDRVVAQLEQGNGQKPSKNDLVRLALMWLLEDYHENA